MGEGWRRRSVRQRLPTRTPPLVPFFCFPDARNVNRLQASTWSLVTGTVAHPDGTVTNVSGHGIVNHVNRNVKPHKASPKLELVKVRPGGGV